ncbi:MAG: SBBP repeat-containing protein, partial [Elusimicrobia bacterium]|nr:SBBP repeat-containing protein [Elusimicrobiota bacterium]
MSTRSWPIRAPKFSRLLLSTLLIGTQVSGLGWSSFTPRLTAPGSARVPAPDQATRARLRAAYGNLPLTFEANQGQTAPQVQFLARGAGSTLFLTPTEAVLTFEKRVLRMSFVGANPAPHLVGHAALPGTANYFIGNDPTRWHTHIPTYKQVTYAQVYPGVDVVYYGTQGHLEYDCVVAAGADPSAITLGFAGADTVAINGEGELVVHLPSGAPLRWHPPVMYQEINGRRQAVSGGYVLLAPPRATGQADKGSYQVGFTVGAYDVSRPVTGWTYSPNFPTTPGAFQTSLGGSSDAFVTKVNPDGTALVYSTYLGGGGEDVGRGIAVDADGTAYVTGQTASPNFPTTPGAFQTTIGGGFYGDAFVTKVNPDGTALVYSTYLGGRDIDGGSGIAVDADGTAYVTGDTWSPNFPTTPGAFQTTIGGVVNAFVTKVNPDGTALVYSTYLGGSAYDGGSGIAVDADGNAYVTGWTYSPNFPTTPGAFQTSLGGSSDAFVTKVNPDGTALVYSTYLGG